MATGDWHWKEKDLIKWVERRASQLIGTGTLLIDRPNLHVESTGVKIEGEAFLSNRKGKAFVTYNLQIEISWDARLMLNQTVIGQAAGRVLMKEISYERTDQDWEIEVQCEFEYRKNPINPTANDREIFDFEQQIKDAIKAPEGVQTVISAISSLENELKKLDQEDHGTIFSFANGKDDTPAPDGDAPLRAVRASVKAVTEENGTTGIEQVDAKIVQKTGAYVRDLQKQQLGANFKCILAGENDDDASWRCAWCSIRDEDMDDLISKLQDLSTEQQENLTSLDLSYNMLTDASVQPLAVALFNGTAPALKSLALDGNEGIGIVGKNVLNGLKLMRKNLVVTCEKESPILKRAQEVKEK